MKHLICLTVTAGAAACLLTACNSSDKSETSVTSAQTLDTVQLLEQARHTSEHAQPYQVDDGALTLTDTSDDTEPLSVNDAFL